MYMPRKKKTAQDIQLESKAKKVYKKSGSDKEDKLIENFEPISKKAIDLIENNYRQILEMQDKILAAPSMNGGFTTLMYKIENIEESQTKLVQKVDQIHDVLYEPDKGLYARVKKIENDCASEESIESLEKDVQEIKIWKSSEEKTAVKDEEKDGKNDKLLLEHESMIRDLQASILKYNAATKWVIVSLGGAIVSLLGKLVYNFISEHVKFI